VEFILFKIFKLVKDCFFVTQAPIGLTEIGLKLDYFGKVNSFNYENVSFYLNILYPVQKPYYLEIN